MSKKFEKLTRPAMRSLPPGKKLMEHGIRYEKLTNGDGRFEIDVMVNSKRIHRVVGAESEGITRQQAEEAIESLKSEARRDRLNLPSKRKLTLTFAEAADLYLDKLRETGGKDLRNKDLNLKNHLTPFFGAMPLAQIATFDVERFKKQRLDSKASKSTINKDLAVFSHLINKSLEWGWIVSRSVVVKRLKEDAGRIVYLTPEQCQTILKLARNATNTQVYPFILIGLETGMRYTEILSIQLENIDLARREIYLPRTKSGDRTQPITEHLVAYLAEYLKTISSAQPWLFPCIGNRTSKAGHTVSIEEAYRDVIKKAGLDPYEIVRHTLRHTAITHLVQAGVNLPTVMDISGHKTLKMVQRYSHRDSDHIRAAMDKLENRLRPVKAQLEAVK